MAENGSMLNTPTFGIYLAVIVFQNLKSQKAWRQSSRPTSPRRSVFTTPSTATGGFLRGTGRGRQPLAHERALYAGQAGLDADFLAGLPSASCRASGHKSVGGCGRPLQRDDHRRCPGLVDLMRTSPRARA